MKKVTLFMKPYSFLYKNDEYDMYSLNDAVSLLNAQMKIIILEEPLFIKIFEIENDIKKMSSFIQDKIDNIFPQNGEILYDYEKNRGDNLLAIYSVKGKKRIEKLSDSVKELEVVPVQLMIKDKLIKKIKNKKLTCGVIFKIEKNFYYLCIKNGLLYENYITEEWKEISDKLLQEDKLEIYIDQNIIFDENHMDDINVIRINVEELIHEKIF